MKPEEKNPGIIDLSSITRPAAKQEEVAPVAAPIPTERALIVPDQGQQEKKS